MVIFRLPLLAVTDSSDRTIELRYNEDNNLTAIINWDESEESGKFTTFGYDDNGYLTTITDRNNKTTEFEYDEDGALETVTSSDGSKIALTYTSLASGKQVESIAEYGINETIGQTLEMERKEYNITTVRTSGVDSVFDNDDDIYTKYEFDNAGRLTTIYGKTGTGKDLGANSLAFTSSAPKSDDSDIKKLNRVVKTASLSPTIINLLTNHSGESTSGWVSGNSSSTASASYSSSSEEHLFGMKSFKIDVTSSSYNVRSRFIQDHDEDIAAGKTYTLSAYVKTEGINIVDTSEPGGAMLLVAVKNSAGWSDHISEYIKGTTDEAVSDGWRRMSVTFTAPEDVEYIRCMMVVMNATGTAYFDGVQLEEGNTPNSYNMIENPSFEKVTNSFADSWSKVNLESNDTASTSAAKYGTRSSRMVGNGKMSKEITQTINITGTEEDTYVISGWLYGKIVENNAHDDDRRADITVTIAYNDNNNTTVKKSVVNFNTSVSGWKYGAGSFNLSDGNSGTNLTAKSITISLRSYHQANKLFFDGIQLIKKEVNIYSYDDNGNLLSDGSKSYVYENDQLIRETDGIDTTFSYDRNDKGNIELVENNINSVVKEYGYDSFSNPTYSIIRNSETGTQILIQDIYDNKGTNLIEKEDADGYITSYDYENGKLTKITDANNNILSYTYVNDLLNEVTKGSTKLKLNYDTNQRITEIKSNDRSYGYEYDNYGNLIKTKLGNNIVSETNYQQNNGDLASIVLKNGVTYYYTYDEYGNTIQVKENTALLIANKYDKEGRLISTTDHKANQTSVFDYDFKDRIIRTSVFNASRIELQDGFIYGYEYGYDEHDRVVKRNYTINGQTVSNNIIYQEGSYITSYSIDNNKTITYGYDDLNRVSSKTINTATPITISYEFAVSARETNYTTSKIDTETIGNIVYTYQYDRIGNITQIKRGSQTIDYKYDEHSRLVREDNQILNKTYVYKYDDNGNITHKSEYAYTTASQLEEKEQTHSYTSSIWKDYLTGYNNQTIGDYDVLGNPGIYRGNTLTWSGRKLTGLTNSSNTISYVYDAGGTRLSKTVGSATTNYTTVDGKVIQEEGPNGTLIYSYDNNGHLAKITHKSTTSTTDYYVVCNSRGDTEAIYNSSGTLVARYCYDSWGKVISITDGSGNNITSSTHIANLNPIRYRGYYYDSETRYYYLQSRYYDPEVSRFISADDISVVSADTASLSDKNLYTYCDNNPINRSDSEGNFWETAFDVASLIASINDVRNNPEDPWAWAGLAGDVLDLLPFVTGAGEITKAFKAVDKAIDVADNVVDTTNTVKKGWKLGDDITTLTKAGNKPSWSTVRQRYWKNEAFYHKDLYTDANLNLMRKGRAPLVQNPDNGKWYPMELHHIKARWAGGTDDYWNLLKVSPWEHDEIDSFRYFKP